jgi:hypothetical protein
MKRALVVLVCLSVLSPAVAFAGSSPPPSVMQVAGTFTTQVVPCGSLCTQSEYLGDLEGTTEFVLTSLEVTRNPAISRYTGTLVLHTDDGDLIGTDVGYWNTTTGKYTDTYRITSGTGVYEGATGILYLSGTGSSKYIGVIHWPCDLALRAADAPRERQVATRDRLDVIVSRARAA